MAEKNFMTAGTEVGEYVTKKNQCLVKISNIIAEACVSRGKSGRVTNSLENDITNLIKELPERDQITVLTKLAVTLTRQLNGSNSNDDDDYDFGSSRRDIFSHRR